jgi:hypothetical protein
VRDPENFVDQLADQVADKPEEKTQQSNKNMVFMG